MGEHHANSGLTKMVRDSTISLEEAENKILSFVKQWIPEKKCPLAGNSVGQDAKFLEKYMPKFMNHLHYRIVDVSTIKELSRRWYPEIRYGAKEEDVPSSFGRHKRIN